MDSSNSIANDSLKSIREKSRFTDKVVRFQKRSEAFNSRRANFQEIVDEFKVR